MSEARGRPRAPGVLLRAPRPADPPAQPPFVTRVLPAAAAAATSILVGAAIVATRSVVGEAGPASLALWRYLIGTCCLLPPMLLSSPVRLARRDLLPIGRLGITRFGILIALLNLGLRFIPAARAALIFSTMPLLTMLLSTALGHERLTTAKALGVLLAIVGVGLALGQKAAGREGTAAEWVGELAVFASAASGAVCTVLYRPYLRRYPTLPVSAVAMLAAVAFLAALAAGEGFFTTLPRFSAGGWLAVVFIGISSGIGYYLWLWALNHATPTQVTAFLSLSPLTATGLGVLFLAERISRALAAAPGFRRARPLARPPAIPHGPGTRLTEASRPQRVGQASTRRSVRRSR